MRSNCFAFLIVIIVVATVSRVREIPTPTFKTAPAPKSELRAGFKRATAESGKEALDRPLSAEVLNRPLGDAPFPNVGLLPAGRIVLEESH
jgi:hypothetical protein